MSGVPGKVSTGAGISLGADGYSTSSGAFSAGTTPPTNGALNIDASVYGGTFLAATNTSGSSITMSVDATTNTLTVNGNVVVTGTVAEAAVSEGPLTITGGTVTTSTPFLQATQSWNAGGVTFTGLKVNITDTASASGSLLIDYQVGGATKFSVTKAGTVSVATGATYQVNGTTVLSATTLGSGVTGSSLTSVGTLTAGAIGSGFTAIPNSALLNPGLQINGTAIVLGGSGTVTAAAGTLTGTTLNATVVSSSLTSVGTLSAGAIPASLVTAGTFGAGAYTFPSTLSVTGAVTQVGATNANFTADGTGSAAFVYKLSGVSKWTHGLNVNTGSTAWDLYNHTTGTSALSVNYSTNAVTLVGALAITGAFTGATTGAFSGLVTFTTSGFTFNGAANANALATINAPTAGWAAGFDLQAASVSKWRMAVNGSPSGGAGSNQFVLYNYTNSANVISITEAGALTYTGAATFSSTLAVTGAATFNAGSTSVVMNASSTYNAIRFNQSGGAQGFIGSDYGQTMCSTSANGDMIVRADATGTILFASSVTERIRFGSTGTITAPTVYSTTVGATNRAMFVDNTGLLGYLASIRAAKTNITPLTDTSWLDELTPVAFNYRKKDEDGAYTDEANTPLEYGLIAEEVEGINPELVFYDETKDGLALRGVSYNKLMIPLLQRIQTLTARVAALEAH